MEKISSIRRGKTINVKWTVTADITLDKDKLTLELIDPVGKVVAIPAGQWSFYDNVVEYTHEGTTQRHIGKYGYTLRHNKGEKTQTVVDKTCAYILVSHTECECPQHRDNLELTTVDLGSSEFNAYPVIGGGGGDCKDCVKYLDASKFTGEAFECDEPFMLIWDTGTLIGKVPSSHFRDSGKYRIDCFFHYTLLGESIYTIIEHIPETQKHKYKGYLQLYRNEAEGILHGSDGRIVSSIDGHTAGEWATEIHKLFGDNVEQSGEFVKVIDLEEHVDGYLHTTWGAWAAIITNNDKKFAADAVKVVGNRKYDRFPVALTEANNNVYCYSIVEVSYTGRSPKLLGYLITSSTDNGLEYTLTDSSHDAVEMIDGKNVNEWKVYLEDLFSSQHVEGSVLVGNTSIKSIDNNYETSSGTVYNYGNIVIDTQKDKPNTVDATSRAAVVMGRGNDVDLKTGAVIGVDNIAKRVDASYDCGNAFIAGRGNMAQDSNFPIVLGQANGIKGENNIVMGKMQMVNGDDNTVIAPFRLDFYTEIDIPSGEGGETTYKFGYTPENDPYNIIYTGQFWTDSSSTKPYRIVAFDKENDTITFDRTLSETPFTNKRLFASNSIVGNRNTVIGGSNNFIRFIKQIVVGWENIIAYSNSKGNTGYSDWGGVTIGCWNDPNKGGRIVLADGGTTKRHTAMVVDMSGNIKFTPKEGAKMTYNGSEVMTKADVDLSQVNLPNDRDSLVKVINRLEKRTEILLERISELEKRAGVIPGSGSIVDEWNGTYIEEGH